MEDAFVAEVSGKKLIRFKPRTREVRPRLPSSSFVRSQERTQKNAAPLLKLARTTTPRIHRLEPYQTFSTLYRIEMQSRNHRTFEVENRKGGMPVENEEEAP